MNETSRLKQYAGVCVGGPYDGQSMVWTSSVREVLITGPYTHHDRGQYEFLFQRWFWKGPRYNPPKMGT